MKQEKTVSKWRNDSVQTQFRQPLEDILASVLGKERWNLRWTNNAEKLVVVPYDGIPFLHCGKRSFCCHLGPDKDKHKKERMVAKRQERFAELDDNNRPSTRRRHTKKIGCPSKVYQLRIVKFPGYSVERNTPTERYAAAKRFRRDLTNGGVEIETQELFFLKIPPDQLHQGHPVGLPYIPQKMERKRPAVPAPRKSRSKKARMEREQQKQEKLKQQQMVHQQGQQQHWTVYQQQQLADRAMYQEQQEYFLQIPDTADDVLNDEIIYDGIISSDIQEGIMDEHIENSESLVRPDLAGYCPASNLSFNEHITQLKKQGKEVYHFAFGQSPFPIMDHAQEALREHAGENAYLPVAGLKDLQKAVCRFHSRYDWMNELLDNQVIIGPGTKELIFLLMNVFNGVVLVVSPSWTTYKPQVTLSHHKPYTIQTTLEGEWRITPEAIEQTILSNNLTGNKLLILCNPDNPTGTSYSAHHLASLATVCRRHNIIVLSDEIYARLHFQQSHVSLAKYYPEGTILGSGLSKWASAGGWRLGYQIYPRELNELKAAVRSAASHTYSCAAAPMQYAAIKLFANSEACDEYIKATTKIMSTLGNYSYRELTSVGVKAVRPKAGYYMMPDFEVCRAGLLKKDLHSCEDMVQLMFKESKVAVMAAGPAFLRPEHELTTRLCFVDFDGKPALEAYRALGPDPTLDDSFIQQYCPNVYNGIQALKKWVVKYSA
ncbi:unnamed protein product [Owenia fusiformis]|uniref:Aminotransferase class I/classII large domain-containing protein n=1 Tax=Owenia fusiformis TaxID=6347 RepID=A0A8S4MUY6_OWEFU|nr:unnamed protein product [Owenia fusiformis]